MHTRDMFERTAQDALPLVLLIDDDLVSREVTATVLTMNGFTVHTAENGAAALALLAAADGRPAPLQPDVILMDSQMPGLSGTQLIGELRVRSQARVYVVSGSNAPSEVTAAADGFLLKPFSAEAFRRLLEGGKPEPAASLLDPKAPVVNAEILAQFRKLMPEAAVRQVYEAVIADLGRRIEALAAAMAKGDVAEVRRIGHAIKGGCGMAGAVEAARLGALLESIDHLGDNQLDNSTVLLQDLRAAARRLQNMLDAGMPA
jgi:two-component system, sensor histidine kinase and response regulator